MTLPFTCATGPMEVPVRCATKKVLLSLSAPALDFGGVVSGEASSLTLTITNAGALPSRYTLTLEDESYPSEAVEGTSNAAAAAASELSAPVFAIPTTGKIGPYGATPITIAFNPRIPARRRRRSASTLATPNRRGADRARRARRRRRRCHLPAARGG